MLRWLLPLLLLSIVEIYSFQAIKTITRSKLILAIYVVFSLLVLAYLFYVAVSHDRGSGQNSTTLFSFGLALVVFVPKFLLTIVLFGEDIFRFFHAIIYYFIGDTVPDTFLPNRRRFVSQVALGIAAIPFSSLLYGIFIGKYNFKVIKQNVFFPDLPSAFDGLKILQISDIHSGSFGETHKIQEAIDLINEQEFDLFLFTGDIVNSHAHEMDRWIETFKGIKTPQYGKFSILGNHDYGTYAKWNNDAEELANFNAIKNIHDKIDFKLMLNEQITLKKEQQEIKLIGVENWGVHFGAKGDLKKAAHNTSPTDFKILMSHDPSHWEAKIKNDPNHYQLTLSGHTHGFQFGIEIPGWLKWSPVQYVYKQWAGLYEKEHEGRFIYVNRGFGFHAYPGRVGIMPEITVLELKRGKKVS